MSGRKFEAVEVCYAGSGERVYYSDQDGATHSIPLSWTDLAPADPFVTTAAGRSALRVADLLEVAGIMARIEEQCGGGDNRKCQ